jgi:hypothetical protein
MRMSCRCCPPPNSAAWSTGDAGLLVDWSSISVFPLFIHSDSPESGSPHHCAMEQARQRQASTQAAAAHTPWPRRTRRRRGRQCSSWAQGECVCVWLGICVCFGCADRLSRQSSRRVCECYPPINFIQSPSQPRGPGLRPRVPPLRDPCAGM